MYSFRYHLITICSVFVALALGLLLGAAIASSELAQTTSDDMLENMMSRYETLAQSNESLEQEAQDSAALTNLFFEPWAKDRLDGRTIVVLFGNTLEDRNLQTELTKTIHLAGGSVIGLTVLKTDFGLDNEETRAALQKIVKEIPGEEYQNTLAKSLVKEWSYMYTASSVEVTDDDFNIASHTYTLAGTSGSLPTTSGEPEPATAFQKIIFDEYPLTRALLSLQIISINADYTSLEEHEDPAVSTNQLAAYRVASAWQLPYGVNGLINCLAQQQDEAMIQTQIGLQLTLRMQEAGTKGDLMYPAWLKSGLPQASTGDVAMPNYYTMLVQPSYLEESMEILASENGLSCVTSPESTSGRYSIVALLSGAQAGIYGENRSQENRFAPLPQDESGKAVFSSLSIE